jgi:hypothetical protein
VYGISQKPHKRNEFTNRDDFKKKRSYSKEAFAYGSDYGQPDLTGNYVRVLIIGWRRDGALRKIINDLLSYK